MFESLRADAVFGWRQIVKNKAASAAAVLSLALAAGACGSAFRLIDALLLRPLPVARPERLYLLTHGTVDSWPRETIQQMREAAADQAALLAVSFAERAELTYGSPEQSEKAHVQYVSGAMFDSFGLRAAAGRLLNDDDEASPVAVLSHDYWSRRFGGDSKSIGRSFRLGDRIYEIIGVAPAGFTGTEPGTSIDIFMPAGMHWGASHPDWSVFRAFAHLPAGALPGPVRDRLSANLPTLRMEAAAAGVSGMKKNYRLALFALGILASLVLLMACVNVANLRTAQAEARTREMALRISLGASRGRVAQLLLVESAILGLLAAGAGGCFAWWSAPFVAARIQTIDNPARLSLAFDGRVAAFSIALTIGVTLLIGLMPAWRACSAVTKRRRAAHWLIAAQTAFCFLVIFAAGLLAATFEKLSHQDTGISAGGLLTLTVVTPKHEPSALWDQVGERLRGVAGVEEVAYSDWALLDGYGFKFNIIAIDGARASETPAWFLNISPGWLETMKIPLVDGRDFRPDDLSPGAAIVNQEFVRKYFGGANPLGKWFGGTTGYMRGQRFQIVGVVRDSGYRFVREAVVPVAFTPFNRKDDAGTMRGGVLVVRAAGHNPLALLPVLRSEVALARTEFRVSEAHSQQDLIDAQTVREKLLAMLALFFAGVAVLLAGVGVYGVLNDSVERRRREIGIRMAIGARPQHIARLVAARIFAMIAAGAVAGVALSIGTEKYLAALLYKVSANDPVMLAIPWLTILPAALAAALPATIRAVRTDPAQMLKVE